MGQQMAPPRGSTLPQEGAGECSYRLNFNELNVLGLPYILLR